MHSTLSLQETTKRLLEAQKIVITAHVNPDGDAIGSSLGLMHILREKGKDVQVLLDDDIPAIFSILPGYELIGKPGEGKITADLLVVLDTGLDRIGAVAGYAEAAAMLNIDHHITNDQQIPALYLDAARAATAEIIFQLAKEMNSTFTPEMALNLYTGMATDSGFFRYSNTTPFTMRAAAELLEAGVKPNIVSEALEQKPYALVKGMAEALQTVEVLHDGKIAGLFLDQALTETLESTEGFIDMVRVIEGVDVAVLLKCKEEKLCRVSMRSKATDVSRIAAQFGGGGHIRAAGCTLEMDFAEAKKVILAAICAAMEEQA